MYTCSPILLAHCVFPYLLSDTSTKDFGRSGLGHLDDKAKGGALAEGEAEASGAGARKDKTIYCAYTKLEDNHCTSSSGMRKDAASRG